MFHVISSHLSTYPEIISISLLFLLLVAGWNWPHTGERFFATAEALGARLAREKVLAMVVIGAAAVLIRLSLLWYLPVPVPHVHDEFSYLLAADTFAHGRLTNPPHQLWQFFDTFHVNQHPSYMSKYPPAQGAMLALGQLMGQPWIGVVLSVALLCAAVLWMLQGWMPPTWALLGAFLVLVRLGIFTYWMNSYWGGAVPAIGGALVVGALPRIMRFQRVRDAIWLGVGAVILANSRPFEGMVLCLTVAAALVSWSWKGGAGWGAILSRLIVPLLAVALLGGTFMGYYNWRLTGDPLLSPYALNDRTYMRTPIFVGQKEGPPVRLSNPQFEGFYNGWVREYWLANRVHSVGSALYHGAALFLKLIYFFLWPELCIGLLAIPWLFRDRQTRFLAIQLLVCLAGSFFVIWFLPHYAAPLTATLFALVALAIGRLRAWKYRGRQVGVGLSRAIVLCAVLLAPLHHRGATLGPEDGSPLIAYRARFTKQLDELPGDHLAIVRYAPPWLDTGEWVYNRAEIDRSKIVWAREIPGVDVQPLLGYFRGRQVWLVEPDASPPRLSRYPGSP